MSQADDIAVEKQHWHWRNSMRPVRFFNMDARAALPFFILVFHARLYTLVLTIIVTLIFRLVEKRGLTFPAAMRSLRVWFIGQNRPALPSFRYRRMRDYG